MRIPGGRRWVAPALAMAFIGATHSDGQVRSVEAGVVRSMVDLVVSVDGRLDAQRSLVLATAAIDAPDRRVGLTAVSLSAGGSWNQPEQRGANTTLGSTAQMGLTFSLRDPGFAAAQAAHARSRTAALLEARAIRERVVADLFDALNRIGDLDRELRRLSLVVERLSERTEEVDAGAVIVEIERVWELEDRVHDARTQVEATRARIDELEVRTAIELGGDRWEELLTLLRGRGTG